MKFETFRYMRPEERVYTFAQSQQLSMQTGLIGYLRADMDTDGKGFFSTWYDFRNNLKTDEFKAEFDEVINTLREDSGILSNRSKLASYCYNNPESAYNDDRNNYGVRIDTDKYSYLLRLNPNKGEYNLYCYCYLCEWLDRHLEKAARGIRFIDSSYNELFRIPDYGEIVVAGPDDKPGTYHCRYIDDYHVEVGLNLYHICEFAEMIEAGNKTVKPVNKIVK